ncbi:MAG TPA: hydrogenase maturation nickel metallochaperone HypA [Thermodesulfobacteriota bacterium]|nr:hydrogenase maturation nickel metallochaperone HypA [Thermodesulfobacteriota bacterium]
MHELSIMQNIVSTVQEYAQANGIDRVVKIIIEVGSLSGVVPESLEFCFELCIADSTLAGSKLEIQRREAVAHCRYCGEEFPLVENDYCCPKCKEADWSIISGRELIIKGLEVE